MNLNNILFINKYIIYSEKNRKYQNAILCNSVSTIFVHELEYLEQNGRHMVTNIILLHIYNFFKFLIFIFFGKKLQKFKIH